jgi:hypothetical protein
MTAKKLFVHELIVEATPRLLWLRDNLPELYGAYFDCGWNSGGVNQIVDADLSDQYSLSAADLGAFITLVEQLVKLLGSGSEAIANADYAATLNKARFAKIG